MTLGSLFFRESLPPDRRSGAGWKNVLKGFGDILREKGFIPASLAYACSMSAIFCYISAAPFIIQQEYNLSDVQFSLIFAFNALVIACGSILSVKFSSVEKSLKFGALLAFFGAACCLLLYFLSQSLLAYLVPVALMLFGLGFMFPSSTTLAMEKGRKYAGIASSVVGGLGYLAGGLAAPLVGIGDIKLASFSWSFVFLLAGLLLIFFCDHRKTRL